MTELRRSGIAILVHEVRSPVAALAAVSEALDDIDEPAARRELVLLAIGACAAVERIVGDLTVSSIRPELIDVGEVVRAVAASNAVVGTSVVAYVEEGLPRVAADPIRLRQALDNLVANARVHGDARSIGLRAARSGDGIALTVTDEGPGMAPEDLDRIFEPGVRLGDAAPGSGLGLWISRTIVEAHRGTIAVDSAVGMGTRVTITLSASQPDT